MTSHDNIPLLITGAALLIFVIVLVVTIRRTPTTDEENAEASDTLDHLIRTAESKGTEFVLAYLTELKQLFLQVVSTHPDHVLTKRLRWIITENMPTLFPFITNSEAQARSLLIPYQNQLNVVKQKVAAGELSKAAVVAHQDFNWEARDYFTL